MGQNNSAFLHLTIGAWVAVVAPCSLRAVPFAVSTSDGPHFSSLGVVVHIDDSRTELNKGNGVTAGYHQNLVVALPTERDRYIVGAIILISPKQHIGGIYPQFTQSFLKLPELLLLVLLVVPHHLDRRLQVAQLHRDFHIHRLLSRWRRPRC